MGPVVARAWVMRCPRLVAVGCVGRHPRRTTIQTLHVWSSDFSGHPRRSTGLDAMLAVFTCVFTFIMYKCHCWNRLHTLGLNVYASARAQRAPKHWHRYTVTSLTKDGGTGIAGPYSPHATVAPNSLPCRLYGSPAPARKDQKVLHLISEHMTPLESGALPLIGSSSSISSSQRTLPCPSSGVTHSLWRHTCFACLVSVCESKLCHDPCVGVQMLPTPLVRAQSHTPSASPVVRSLTLARKGKHLPQTRFDLTCPWPQTRTQWYTSAASSSWMLKSSSSR